MTKGVAPNEMQIRMMNGRVCLITGATSGIGKATALALARLGATIVFTARDPEKGEEVRDQLKTLSGNEMIELMECDLSSLQSVKECCDRFRSKHDSLHVLLNNAGTWEKERKLSKDGIEITFAVNHLAPFLMTNLLLDVMKKSAPARIISVSSGLHGGTVNLDDVEFKKGFRGMRAYRQSKLADILFIKELAKRLQGTGVTANSLMPGFVATGLSRNSNAVSRAFVRILAASPEKGARTSIYLASSPDVEKISGECFSSKKIASLSGEAVNQELASRLWDMSVKYTERWMSN